jgi:hypothetical protein
LSATITATPHRIGKLFEILTEHGEDMHFRWLLTRDGGAAVAEAQVHHKDADGYGSLVTFLRANGIAFEAPKGRPEVAPPPMRERIAALFRVLTQKGGDDLEWTRKNAAWRRGERVTHRPDAARVLTKDETARVRQAAKRDGVSVNSLLLHALNETVTPKVARAPTRVSWGVPVNMRGPVRVEPELANASSIVPVTIRNGAPAREVEETIRAVIDEKLHWGKWDQINLMVRFGERATRKKIQQYYASADPTRIGVFSNVGVWTGTTEPDVGLLVYGTPTLVDPIFAAAVSWNERLGLTLRVHPSITSSDDDVATWLAVWLDRLLA